MGVAEARSLCGPSGNEPFATEGKSPLATIARFADTLWSGLSLPEALAMRTAGVFILDIQPETASTPTRLSIALTGGVPDLRGVLNVTRQCMTLDELEGCINAIQDELDVIRAEARRAFAGSTGHA